MAANRVVEKKAKSRVGVASAVNDSDLELLTGMGNCHSVCGEDFEETVRMVSSARGLTPDVVKARLNRLREVWGESETYQALRARLPDDFPF
ncbi:MAG: hypothetical protein LN413_03345 [Candidatus Thermoplasmatota archaeon]|nr:hypothetical protein [Candidatus Thermoplasmatota archaeon]